MSASRAAQIHIDLPSLADNFQRARELAPQSRIMPVIKANAYGHGMLRVARALEQADGFAVAQLGEAVQLRNAGIHKPVSVFQGYTDTRQLTQIQLLRLRPAISQLWQIELLEQSTQKQPLDVWLKLNTGMGRLGIQPEDVEQALSRLQAIRHVKQIGLLSHFANADSPGHASNQQQLDRFRQLKNNHDVEASLSNSAALMSYLVRDAGITEDWVRPGIMLYGASPFPDKSAASLGLKPVMQVTASLIAINQLRKGDAIGYGHRWQCPEDMPVGVVNIGYGDGYSRQAIDGTPVIVNQQRTHLIGRVSMDSIMVDLRDIDARCGDTVELLGSQLPVDEVAEGCNTISYELLCNLGAIPA